MRLPWQTKWKPVSVLTGFLGSGKTTILQQLLTEPAMSGTALIINEFGEVAVDHLLVETAEEKMVLLANGCVCCSVRGDLVTAIKSLFDRMRQDEIPPFQRLLLETTGLADPGPIVQSLIGPALQHYPVYFDSIVTLVDASSALQRMPQHPQMYSQIAVADSLLLSKCDLVSPERCEEVQVATQKLNPRAQFARVPDSAKPPSLSSPLALQPLFFGQKLLDPHVSPRELRASRTPIEPTLPPVPPKEVHNCKHGHEHGIHSFVIVRDKPLSYSTFSDFMRQLTLYRGEDLLRVKGLVNIAGSSGPTVVHAVQSVVHPPTKLKRWPTSDKRSQLVFITRNIGEADVENLLAGIEGSFR